MTALDSQDPPGWFGKLPMLGDFAHRRLPGTVIEPFDAWLSAGIAQSRMALGPSWLDTYLGAPVWCFALAPSVIDSAWWPGILMPSVDAVGRYFPLLVMRASPVMPTRSDTLAGLSSWYRAVADGALSTLQPRATLETFEAQLAAIPWHVGDAERRMTARSEAGEFTIAIDNATDWLEDAPAIALRTALGGLADHSFWWPLASQPQAAEVSIVRGLPAPERFAH